LTRALLRSGAPIGEVNTVRKHLSRIKGGRLARAGQRASEILTLAVSDVPRDDASAIASGPTVPDPTTLADARAIVARYKLDIDDAVRRALDDPANESCKPGDAAFARAHFELIARPKQSLDAAVKLASNALERCGFTPAYTISGGAADANVFNERGLACVNLANGMAEIHTPDEHIAVSDLERMVDVTLALVDVARETDAA